MTKPDKCLGATIRHLRIKKVERRDGHKRKVLKKKITGGQSNE